jgi:mannitol/fructose-specific phosphotransferase system IIA component (Ntr-type)
MIPDQPIYFDHVVPDFRCDNKSQFIEKAAFVMADATGMNTRILEVKLGEATKDQEVAVGEGIGLLHISISGLLKPLSYFFRLEKPLDMNAHDSQGVSFFIVLLSPEREGAIHLPFLARTARLLRDAQIRDRFFAAVDENEIRLAIEQSAITLLAA